MTISVNEILLSPSKDQWLLKGRSTLRNIESIELYLTEIKEFKHPSKVYSLSFSQKDEDVTIHIPTKLVFQSNLNNQETLWKLRGRIDESSFVNIIANDEFKEQESSVETSLFKYQFLVNNENLELRSKKKFLKATILESRFKGESLECKFEFNRDLNNCTIKYECRRRPLISLYNYHEQLVLSDSISKPLNGNYLLTLDFDKVSNVSAIDNNNVCDVTIHITSCFGEEQIIYLDVLDKKNEKDQIIRKVHNKQNNVIIKPYITGSNRLSFYLQKNNLHKASLNQIEENNNIISFRINISESTPLFNARLVLKRRDKIGNISEYYFEKG
ncbi:hypothetical protein [Terrilactibacillus laevilacticus]|uniref:hypothetical protein n=1 Tax=Terrilactibacillus laevilacticus TaxID=1380157 RepID=UPI001146FCA4|nr:hypothetical protein [Terrilactibacillus laevilacticus]